LNVYDFDDTILSGDTTYRYFFNAFRYPAAWKALPGILWNFVLYGLKKREFIRYKEVLFSYLKYLPEDAVEAFWDRNMKRIKAYYPAQKREDDVVITASPEFLVRPAMERLGVKNVIGTEMDPRTGRITGENCKRAEKVRRFYEAYPGGKIDEFYSDSLSDTPLAELAEKAFLVKGETLLPWPKN